jgi:glycosyltransferase involved in cell wall biosynthesis
LRQQALHFGADPGRSHLVHWGVDSSIFHPAGDPTALRSQLGIYGDPVILSPRAVHRVYNLEVLVNAIPEVLSHYPQARFVLRNYNTDTAYLDELKRQIAGLDIAANVIWVGPLTHWEDSAQYYQAADLVVSVPSSDATSVSILEAMACGTPVIASDLPSLQEWITSGENGWLVPVGDPGTLASAILKLLNNAPMRFSFLQKNLELVKNHLSHQAQMEKMERLYQDLANNAPRAAK